MSRELFLLLMVGLVGCPLIAPLSSYAGGGSDARPTIDFSTPIKSPEAPSTKKIELKPSVKEAK
jgi:hypothetical protein